MDEVAELKTLSEFIQARAAIAPTGGRALNEFLAAMRKELAELDVKSFCGQTLIDALIDRIDTRLRFEKLKKRIIIVQILLIIILFVLALVVPHADISWAAAVGR